MADKKRKHVDIVAVPEQDLVEKQFDPASITSSVVDTPTVSENRSPFGSVMLMAMSAADSIIPFGTNVSARDIQLRSFVAQEPTLSSAVYSVCIRNASFEWEIISADPEDNPKKTIKAVEKMLHNSDWGSGWMSLIVKTCFDLYTQDNGAFWELIRVEDSPTSPVIMIALLDSARCTRTGDPENPVIYDDRKGKSHIMKWYNVVTLEEMPMPVETLYNSQMCALSRALKMTQIIRDELVYKHEKVSGRNPRAIDFVSGVTQTEIQDAVKYASEQANNLGMSRFPVYHIVAGVDPSNPVAHQRIDLASLPDNFSFDDEMKWYVAILAMAFGVDYQELAPLPGGQMGSSQQSEILHLKTRGKGPAALMTMITHIMNNSGILPRNVTFHFKFHDIEAEKAKADAGFLRAKSRAIRLDSGEIDPIAARKLAVQDGDLPLWLAEEMEGRDIERPSVSARQPRDPGMKDNTRSANGDKPNPLTVDQFTGGNDSRSQVKSDDGVNSLSVVDMTADITEQDIEREKQILAERLLTSYNVLEITPPQDRTNTPMLKMLDLIRGKFAGQVTLREKAQNPMPSQINITMPEQPAPIVIVNVPEQLPPVVNIPETQVTVNVPETQVTVNVPETQVTVNVPEPQVTVNVPQQPVPQVIVNLSESEEVLSVERNARGQITDIKKRKMTTNS